jgi:hypothetical protein
VINAAGGPRGGPWNVLVERDGEYEITLRRWAPDVDLPLSAGFPGRKMTAGSLPEGKALPIGRAHLTIAGQEQTKDAASGAQGVPFRVRLKGGTRTQLHGWFQDAAGKDLCGVFYAHVRRI